MAAESYTDLMMTAIANAEMYSAIEFDNTDEAAITSV